VKGFGCAAGKQRGEPIGSGTDGIDLSPIRMTLQAAGPILA